MSNVAVKASWMAIAPIDMSEPMLRSSEPSLFFVMMSMNRNTAIRKVIRAVPMISVTRICIWYYMQLII